MGKIFTKYVTAQLSNQQSFQIPLYIRQDDPYQPLFIVHPTRYDDSLLCRYAGGNGLNVNLFIMVEIADFAVLSGS